MSERLSNRRIRLLLGVFVLVFAATLARAVWLQGVQASTLERMAVRQQEATTELPAARGTIYDRTGEPLAIGEQATTVYADPRRVKNPRRVALAAAEALGLDAEKLYPLLADRSRHFVYVKRKADPAKAAELEQQRPAGLGFYAEELRSYPQRAVAAHVLGYAGVDNEGLEGLERSLDRSLRGKPGSQTDGDGSRRPRHRRRRDAARAAGRRRLPDARPPHPGERRVGPARDGEALGREGGQRDRARPAHGCRAGDGGLPELRRQRLRLRLGRASSQPRRHRRLRAGLDVQGRHGRGRALREDRHPDDAVHAAVVDPRRGPDHPRARAAPDAADDGRADPLAVVQCRHDHARADARPDARRAVDRPLRLRQADRDRRARGVRRPAARPTGRARRSATCRSARGSA